MMNSLRDHSVIHLKHPNEELVIAPGGVVSIPVWVRGDRIGKHSLRFIFRYESVVWV